MKDLIKVALRASILHDCIIIKSFNSFSLGLEKKLFDKETVIITGAGSSVHYGYPTGAGLLKKVREVAELISSFFSSMLQANYGNLPAFLRDGADSASPRMLYKKGLEEVNDFRNRLDLADPVVIDYFLGQNLHLERLGKLLISWIILECERNSAVFDGNYLRHIVHHLALDCRSSGDLLKNKVSFITFNYDTSLERRLRSALSGLSIFDPNDIELFLVENRFEHVYGAVNNGSVPAVDFSGVFTDVATLPQSLAQTIRILDSVYASSKSLSVIDPANKNVSESLNMTLRDKMAYAETLIVLGFGFDKFNISLLNLADVRKLATMKDILVTNYGNSSRINQAIGKIFTADGDSMIGVYIPPKSGPAVRKSIGNVDYAFMQDFDIP